MLLATLAGLALAGIAGYQYRKNKDKDKKNIKNFSILEMKNIEEELNLRKLPI